MNIDALNRMYYGQTQVHHTEGMPRALELAVQKFLEPIIEDIFQDQEVEISLKLLNTLTNLAHTVYLMGKADGSHGYNLKPETGSIPQ
jgi:hypothetical protein